MEPHKGLQMFHTERNNRDQTPWVGVVLQQASEKRTKKLILEKKHDDSIDLNLRKFILLDSQLTMYLLCNEYMVEIIYNSKKNMRIQMNGGKMVIDNKAV